MGFVFYLISALAVGGALAAVLLKNLVHCGAGADARVSRPGASVSSSRCAVCWVRADPCVRRRGGDPGCVRHFADERVGYSERRRLLETWFAGLAIAAAVFAVLALGGAAGWRRGCRMKPPHRSDGERHWQCADGPVCAAAGDCRGAADRGAAGRGDRGHAREREGEAMTTPLDRISARGCAASSRLGWRAR